MGVLYGKYDLLDKLTAYRVQPAPADPPGMFEIGTGNFEGMYCVLWVSVIYHRTHCKCTELLANDHVSLIDFYPRSGSLKLRRKPSHTPNATLKHYQTNHQSK